MKIKLFGLIAEKLNAQELEVEAVTHTEELRRTLLQKFPTLKGVEFAVAVDREIVSGTTPLDEDREVALLPPFSGG